MLKKLFKNLFPERLTLKDEYDYIERLVKSCRTNRELYEIEAKVIGIIMKHRKSANEEIRQFANSTDDLLLNRKDELESEELAKYSQLAKQQL